jgi:hypothetical protein
MTMSKELELTLMERRWVAQEGRDGEWDAGHAADPYDVPTVAELVESYMESTSRQFDELDDGSKPRAAVVRMGAQAWAENWHIYALRLKRSYDERRRRDEEG